MSTSTRDSDIATTAETDNIATTAEPDQIPFSSIYCMVAKTVDCLMKADQQDMLPDTSTELVLGMSGEEGRVLYCAISGLISVGRMSRTMLEQAMCYSPTSYEESVKLWIRSLPPDQRHRNPYVIMLIESKFKNLPWNTDPNFPNYFLQVGTIGTVDESQIWRISPIVPLGEHRHSPRSAKAIRVAQEFYRILSLGVLFEGPESPPDLSMDHEDTGHTHPLSRIGSFFGIDPIELPWEGCMRGIMTISELMLRTWNALYYCQRLSYTELECALMGGTMRTFLTRAVTIALSVGYENQLFAKHGRTLFLSVIDILQGNNSRIQGDPPQEDYQLVFQELSVDGNVDRSNERCDECDAVLEKPQSCSKCKIAIYCNRSCQKKDWVRHKYLCSQQ